MSNGNTYVCTYVETQFVDIKMWTLPTALTYPDNQAIFYKNHIRKIFQLCFTVFDVYIPFRHAGSSSAFSAGKCFDH
jgi:hypothetical protein